MRQVRLALSGSGFLAPIHAGAVCALLDADVEIIEVAGTSGGSIVAAAVAAGLTPSQIRSLAMANAPSGVMRLQLLRALGQWAINDGKVLRSWLGQIVGETTRMGDAKIDLTIMASDVMSQTGVAFTSTETPDLLMADACRMSASVPGVWAPVWHDGHLIADGGMACNIPTDRLVKDQVPRLGIQVTEASTTSSISTLLGFAESCIGTMLSSNEGNLVAWATQTGATILPVSASPYGFLDPNLTTKARQTLFERGYLAVSTYLGRTQGLGR